MIESEMLADRCWTISLFRVCLGNSEEMKMQKRVWGMTLGILLASSAALAWPGPDMGDLAGSWRGCEDGSNATIQFTKDGIFSTTDDNDQTRMTFCDAYTHTGNVHFYSDELTLLCPSTNDDGTIDVTSPDSLQIHFIDHDHISLATDLDTSDLVVLQRSGATGPGPCTSKGVSHLLALLKKHAR
jgi:hypothetical protein